MQALEHEPFTVSEQSLLEKIERTLANATSVSLLVGSEEVAIELPVAIVQMIQQMVHHMARERTVFLIPMGPTLTTQEAAEILSVSRPYVIKLLETGKIPFTKVGVQRRIRIDDVLNYRKVRGAEQEAALAEIARISQELGLYDDLSPNPLIRDK